MLNNETLRKVKGNPSAEIVPGRRLKLDPAFREFAYDMPKELIAAVLKRFPPEQWIRLEGESADSFLERQGWAFMEYLMAQADSDKFRDRTAEMIEMVAKQTGINFPHRFERYLELGILSLRPRDTWTVTEATTRALKLRSFNCSLAKLLQERGLPNCYVFCLSAATASAGKLGEKLEMKQSAVPEAAGYCELAFRKA